MKYTEVSEEKLLSEYISNHYNNECVIVAWLDCIYDFGKSFLKEEFGLSKIVADRHTLIQGTEDELRDLLKRYHTLMPYMQLYIDGEYYDKNT